MNKIEVKYHVIVSDKTKPDPYYIMVGVYIKEKFNGMVYVYTGGGNFSMFYYQDGKVLSGSDEGENEDIIDTIQVGGKGLAGYLYDFLEENGIVFSKSNGNLVKSKKGYKLQFLTDKNNSISSNLGKIKPISAGNIFFK